MSAVAVGDADARAEAVRAFLRRHRRRVRPTVFQLYVGLLVGAIVGALLEHAVATLIGGGLRVTTLSTFAPLVVALVLLGAARFGSWHGAVSFPAAAVALLWTAPIAIASLVRARLDHGLLAGAALGATLGVLLVLVVAGGPASLGILRVIGAILAVSATGLLAVALSWLVQSSRGAEALVRRAGPLIPVTAAALLLAGLEPAGRAIAAWSGPWGWATVPITEPAGWPVAVGLLVVLATIATVWARRRAGAVTAEGFLARAEVRSRLDASAIMLDYRGAALAYRDARPTASVRRGRLRRPRESRHAIAWRDATALIRDRARTGWAVALCAASTLEALTHAGAVLPAVLAAVGLSVAASLLCEPLRVDVDDPDRASVLLSWTFARVLVAHCAIPFVVLAPVAAATILAAVLAGLAGAGALALVVTMLAPVIAVAVLGAALGARRGGRIDEAVLARLFSVDPSSPAAALVMPIVVAPWLCVTVLAVAGAATILGAAVAHHHAVLVPGIAATALAWVVALGLARTARRSRRPE